MSVIQSDTVLHVEHEAEGQWLPEGFCSWKHNANHNEVVCRWEVDYVWRKCHLSISEWGDDSFFLDNNDFGIVSNRQDYWIEFINQLKFLWKTIDQDNKDIIWKYFHVLVVLGEKCESTTHHNHHK